MRERGAVAATPVKSESAWLQVESDGTGGWVEVGSREAAAAMQRRYILSAAVQDFTGDRTVNLFNEQAAAVLGASADDLHALKVPVLSLVISSVFLAGSA